MTTDNIAEVGIDDKERIYIKPETKHFEFIWRDASEVGWDDKEKVLYTHWKKYFTRLSQRNGHILIGIVKFFWRQKANMDVSLF